MRWLVLAVIQLSLITGCCDCKPFIKTKLDSRIDNRWEGPTLTNNPLAGIKCRY